MAKSISQPEKSYHGELNLVLVLFVFISVLTIFISSTKPFSRPQVLGSSVAAAKIYDDNNGTLYIEYSNPYDVYTSVSSWQGKYPGRTIYASTSLPSESTKTFAIIFNYIGR